MVEICLSNSEKNFIVLGEAVFTDLMLGRVVKSSLIRTVYVFGVIDSKYAGLAVFFVAILSYRR